VVCPWQYYDLLKGANARSLVRGDFLIDEYRRSLLKDYEKRRTILSPEERELELGLAYYQVRT
jgi:hypothetical protein